jgi:hypothetical protein
VVGTVAVATVAPPVRSVEYTWDQDRLVKQLNQIFERKDAATGQS